MDDFTRQYIECALWISTDDEGDNLDDYSINDLDEKTLNAMIEDCKSFQERAAQLKIGEDLTENGGGHAFAFFALMMVVQAIVVWKYFPETKGKTLEQLGKELTN